MSDKRLFWISTCPKCNGTPMWPVLDKENKSWVYHYCGHCVNGKIREEVKVSVTIGQVDITRWLPHREQMASWSVSCEGRTPEYLPMCLWPHTRGQFRRLCAALGVELKEGE
jgi:hypothetical protein